MRIDPVAFTPLGALACPHCGSAICESDSALDVDDFADLCDRFGVLFAVPRNFARAVFWFCRYCANGGALVGI